MRNSFSFEEFQAGYDQSTGVVVTSGAAGVGRQSNLADES